MNFVVDIATWAMYICGHNSYSYSSLAQTMTPWLKKSLFVAWAHRSLVPPPGSAMNEEWQTS